MKKAMCLMLAALLTLTLIGCASAEANFPNDTITIVVPYSAGGGNDVNARRLATKFEEVFGVKAVVENIPGGSTLTGTLNALARPADGYTLIASACTSMIGSPLMYGNAYDVNDFIPLVSQNSVPMVLVASPDAPVTSSAEDFIEYAKANPGTITVGCAGYTDSSGMGLAIAFAAMGIEADIVPFDSAADSLAAVLGGHVMYANMPTSKSLASVENGDLIPLFEFGGFENVFNVPTVIDLGYPEGACPYYRLISCKAGTPDEVVKILREGLAKIITDPEMIAESEAANDPLLFPILDGEEIEAQVQKDWVSYGEVIERLGLGQ